MLRAGFSVLFLSVLFGANAGSQYLNSDAVAVRGVMEQETAAWSRYNAEAVAALYTADAVWQNPFGIRLQGKDDIEKYLTKLFKQPGYRAAKITSGAQIIDMHFPVPNVAVVWSEETIEGQIDEATRKSVLPRHSTYMQVLVKKSGSWKISACMIMDEIKHP